MATLLLFQLSYIRSGTFSAQRCVRVNVFCKIIFQTIPTMWRRTRPDCIVWLVSFFGVMLFGVVGGLASGVMALMGSLVFNLINSAQFKPIGQYQQSEYYFDNTR